MASSPKSIGPGFFGATPVPPPPPPASASGSSPWTPATGGTAAAGAALAGTPRSAAGGGSGVGGPSVSSNIRNQKEMTAAGAKRPVSEKKVPKKRKRKVCTDEDDDLGRGGRAEKGLRHFSLKVCKKVEEKMLTTYNEVADELVYEYLVARKDQKGGNMEDNEDMPKGPADVKGYDEKNIRRRVYDALNVLMAMDIIKKEKKQITWRGLPTTTQQDVDVLRKEQTIRTEEIRRKRECLQDLIVQNICLRNLVRRNQRLEEAKRSERSGAIISSKQSDLKTVGVTNSKDTNDEERIRLPFVVINTIACASIQCEMSPEQNNVHFDFDRPFHSVDDIGCLKRLGMDVVSREDIEAILPSDLLSYCDQNNILKHVCTLPKKKYPSPSQLSSPFNEDVNYERGKMPSRSNLMNADRVSK